MAKGNRLLDEHARRLRTLETLGTDILTPALSALYMPQLHGFWPCSSVDENGDVYDLSAQARTLTNNGTMVFGSDLLDVYAIFDGVDDFLSRTGADAGLHPPGDFTIFGWFYNTDLATPHGYISRWDGIGNLCEYALRINGAGVVNFQISADGINANKESVSSSETIAAGQWHFAAGRFTASTTIDVVVNDVMDSTATGTASVFNSGSTFYVGFNDSEGHFGRGSLFGLCMAALNDTQLAALYRNGRALFGV